MILISHRGNINGKNLENENSPEYIDKAIKTDYNVEIDIRIVQNRFYLGHDEAQHEVTLDWLFDRRNKLWIHCKNLEALIWFTRLGNRYNYFWHEEDTATLTSRGYIWAYPGKQPIENSIGVLPELYDDNINYCAGVCSDYIQKYKWW